MVSFGFLMNKQSLAFLLYATPPFIAVAHFLPTLLHTCIRLTHIPGADFTLELQDHKTRLIQPIKFLQLNKLPFMSRVSLLFKTKLRPRPFKAFNFPTGRCWHSVTQPRSNSSLQVLLPSAQTCAPALSLRILHHLHCCLWARGCRQQHSCNPSCKGRRAPGEL